MRKRQLIGVSPTLGTVRHMTETHGGARNLTPRQLRTLDDLLSIGMDRPYCRPGLAGELESVISQGTAEAVASWTSRSLFVTKSQIQTALRCEGQLIADTSRPRTGFSAPIAVGIVAHRAVQLSYTHPGRPVSDYVREAVIGARSGDEKLDEWWAGAGTSVQSDILMQINSRVLNFLDDWPPLDSNWNPRFEEPISARVGRLTLSCRADLIIGRPRADLRQTLLIVDLKTGAIKDEHRDEAMFYALVATLRHGVAPWRSTIYSLASGEWTDADVTEADLFAEAERVSGAVRSIVAALAETRPVLYTAGDHCRWCPASETCAANLAAIAGIATN